MGVRGLGSQGIGIRSHIATFPGIRKRKRGRIGLAPKLCLGAHGPEAPLPAESPFHGMRENALNTVIPGVPGSGASYAGYQAELGSQKIIARARFRAEHCPSSPWVFCNQESR